MPCGAANEEIYKNDTYSRGCCNHKAPLGSVSRPSQDFPGGPGLPASNVGDMGLIPGWGTKIAAKNKKKPLLLPSMDSGLPMKLSLRGTRATEDGLETSSYPQHLVQSVSH